MDDNNRRIETVKVKRIQSDFVSRIICFAFRNNDDGLVYNYSIRIDENWKWKYDEQPYRIGFGLDEVIKCKINCLKIFQSIMLTITN